MTHSLVMLEASGKEVSTERFCQAIRLAYDEVRSAHFCCAASKASVTAVHNQNGRKITAVHNLKGGKILIGF